MNKMEAQKCPICGAGVLTKKIGTETFEYKGNTTIVSNYITYECAVCGEAVVDHETLKESGKILKDFQRKVDGRLTGTQIKAIRAKLTLTQEQLAHIIGGGLKSVARYESGRVCQSKGMDNLLRILDAYPHTLKVIQRNESRSVSKSKVTSIEEFKKSSVYRAKNTSYSSDEEEIAHGS